MKEKQVYTSGQFARKAHVTLRTLRYYDAKNILKPSSYSEKGNRLYTEGDFAKLQQILLWKYLGFSLEDIQEMMMMSEDAHFMRETLQTQKILLLQRIEEMQSMVDALDQTSQALEENRQMNWNAMMDVIHLTSMEHSLKAQYQNATNISVRISLHKKYSTNPEGWFHWLLSQCPLKENMRILEIGCGNGTLWKENLERLPASLSITLTDISEGMVMDASQSLGKDPRFSFDSCDAGNLPFEEERFDVVIANHVLFYCDPVEKVPEQVQRVLKKDGVFLASTYGKHHMMEITELVQEFNEEIVLSARSLQDVFGLENGKEVLSAYFSHVEERDYKDSIYLKEADPLIAYIVSCHGNQNRLLLDRYREFKEFVEKKVQDGFTITKQAGVFVSRK